MVAMLVRGQVCTSFIALEPQQLNLGDIEVGRLKAADVIVRNLSELPARVHLRHAPMPTVVSRRRQRWR
jgi:hypothetical protein